MKISLVIVLLFMLTACFNAHKDSFTLTATSPDRIWRLAGKISVKYDSEAFASRFRWKQDRYSSEILFKNPFGQYIKVTISDGLSVLENSAGSTIKNDSLKSLMSKELGWSFPLETLSAWFGGLLHTEEKLRDHGVHKEVFFSDDGWKMVVEEFSPGSNLPRRLRFSSDEVEIKLIIKEWESENGKID